LLGFLLLGGMEILLMNSQSNKPVPSVSASNLKISQVENITGDSLQSKRRRYWTKAFKRDVVETILSMNGDQEAIGNYLREKGLYMVLYFKWKSQYENGEFLNKPKAHKTEEESALFEELKKLQSELASAKETINKMNQKLTHAEIIIDAQKKISKLFALP
jgi:transposase-like protein